jgi:hypothetical protein
MKQVAVDQRAVDIEQESADHRVSRLDWPDVPSVGDAAAVGAGVPGGLRM